MGKERDTRNGQGSQPDPDRRKLGMGLLAVLGGGLGVANTAHAFAPGSQGNFNAASSILDRYGVRVIGDVNGGHDRLTLETVPLALTEYSQVVGTRNRLGGLDPCVKTSVFGDDASFTHFHPGEIIPCVRTAIEGHALATHELFDADQGGIDPCYRVTAEMLDGSHIGTVTATHFHPTEGGIVPCFRTTINEGHTLATFELFDAGGGGIDNPNIKVETEMLDGGVLGAVDVTIDNPNIRLSLRVGGNTYNLFDGRLVLEGSIPA